MAYTKMYANSGLSSPMRLVKKETKVEPSYNDIGYVTPRL